MPPTVAQRLACLEQGGEDHKCTPFGAGCRTPNPWIMFRLAYSRLPELQRGRLARGIRHASALYRARKAAGEAPYDDGQEGGVRFGDHERACDMYSRFVSAGLGRPRRPSLRPSPDRVAQAVAAAAAAARRARAAVPPAPAAAAVPRPPTLAGPHTLRLVARVAGGGADQPPRSMTTPPRSWGFLVRGGGPMELLRSTFDRVMSSQDWLNDDALSAFVSLLWGVCKANGGRVVVMPPMSMTIQSAITARSKRYDNFCDVCGVPPGELPALTAIPINVRNSHWYVVAYDHGQGHWWMMDSMHGSTDACADMLTRQDGAQIVSIRDGLDRLTRQRAPGAARVGGAVVSVGVPRQRDFYQCGVWSCMYMLCMAAGARFPRELLPQETVLATVTEDNCQLFASRAREFLRESMHTDALPPYT